MASIPQAAGRDWARFFDDVVRCEIRLYNGLSDRLRERHGIVTSQFEFLQYVRDHANARVADLAGYFAIGVGATSKGIDRLEAHGWVRRLPNPADRRSSLLALTPSGLQLVGDAEATFAEETGAFVGRVLTPTQLAAAAEAMAALRAALEREQIGVPVG
jgi:MarR family transcriptional regulator, multiple antibiotic resistance protein MarR